MSNTSAAASRSSRNTDIIAGLKDSLSVGLGVFPLGIALGMLVMQAELPWWLAPALSIGVYAGSVELL
ncbi:MAG: AzlC family ABC transporter permease, partial [Canibacter sp.]